MGERPLEIIGAIEMIYPIRLILLFPIVAAQLFLVVCLGIICIFLTALDDDKYIQVTPTEQYKEKIISYTNYDIWLLTGKRNYWSN